MPKIIEGSWVVPERVRRAKETGRTLLTLGTIIALSTLVVSHSDAFQDALLRSLSEIRYIAASGQSDVDFLRTIYSAGYTAAAACGLFGLINLAKAKFD